MSILQDVSNKANKFWAAARIISRLVGGSPFKIGQLNKPVFSDELYNNFPENYERFVSHYDLKPIMSVVNTYSCLQKKVVLDVGAGTGQFTFPIAHSAHKVYALERSRRMIEIINKKIIKLDMGNIEIVQADARNYFPFCNKTVDLVFFGFSLDNICGQNVYSHTFQRKSYLRTLVNAKRVLKEGGQCIIVDSMPEKRLIGSRRRIYSTNRKVLFDILRQENFNINIVDYFVKFESIEEAIDITKKIIGEQQSRMLFDGCSTIHEKAYIANFINR